jgi:hypothetical protein
LPAARLAEIAAGLGADVPFFLNGPTALGAGIGERLERLPSPSPTWLALARPAVEIAGKTARLYRALRPADFSDGARTRAHATRLRAGQGLEVALLVNAFARPLREEYPAVAAAEAALRAAGATVVFPAGSGPTLAALCADEETARALAAAAAGPERWVGWSSRWRSRRAEKAPAVECDGPRRAVRGRRPALTLIPRHSRATPSMATPRVRLSRLLGTVWAGTKVLERTSITTTSLGGSDRWLMLVTMVCQEPSASMLATWRPLTSTAMSAAGG